jgi:hypothetical protein
MLNTIPSYLVGAVTEAAFTDAVLADLDRAAAVGADEMHISLNLGTPVPPNRQAELLAALAAQARPRPDNGGCGPNAVRDRVEQARRGYAAGWRLSRGNRH